MAKIITNGSTTRRTIRLSTNDIISIVREYQQLMRGLEQVDAQDVLGNTVLYLPEDI